MCADQKREPKEKLNQNHTTNNWKEKITDASEEVLGALELQADRVITRRITVGKKERSIF